MQPNKSHAIFPIFGLVLIPVALFTASNLFADTALKIISRPNATFTIKKPASFEVRASDPKATFTQAGLPPDLGLQFDGGTGVLSGTPTKAGTFNNITFTAIVDKQQITQQFTLSVRAAKVAAVPVSSPCDPGALVFQLRFLQSADADGLAQALNNTFDGISAVTVPEKQATSGQKQDSTRSAGQPSGDGSTDQALVQRPPKQFVCVSSGDFDTAAGKLKPYNAPAPETRILVELLRRLDRPEFAGVGLDSRFVVDLVNLDADQIASALPALAPGFELSSDDSIGDEYLVLHPASIDLQLATKAGSNLAVQAAKVKHDLLALDAQLQVNYPTIHNFLELEKSDAAHTVHLLALNPREVALSLTQQFVGRNLQVLGQQRAVLIRPSALNSPLGDLKASESIERESLYEQIAAEGAWEQKLQTDGASGGKPSSASSSPQPVTQTNSTTTITTPSSQAPPTVKPSLQVQTTTTTQTTSPNGGQGGSNSPNGNGGQAAGSSPASNSPSNSGPNSGSSSGAEGGAGAAGAGGKQAGNSSGKPLTTGSTQPVSPSQTGQVVRLFHLRQASTIAAALNALAPAASSPVVQPLSDFGNDDLLLFLPPAPGQPDNTDSLRRTIAYLDEPRPAVSLQVWSYELSSKKSWTPSDFNARGDRARDVSDAYVDFIQAVQESDDRIQLAMAAGLANAVTRAHQPGFFDPGFEGYLTGKFQDCVKRDNYCLGYETALELGPLGAPGIYPYDKAVVSLDRFAILLAASSDSQAQSMIDTTVSAMSGAAAPQISFGNLQNALRILAQPPNLHMYRAAVLDFLFQYKLSQAYPDDFDPYYFQRSAQKLDGYLNTLVIALNKDLDLFIHRQLDQEAHEITASERGVGLANYGEVQVSAISGDAASLSAAVNNYFDITQPSLLKDLVGGLLSGAGASSNSGSSDSSSSSTQSSGSGGGSGSDSSGNSGGGKGSGSSSGSSKSSGSGGASGAGAALASASKLLTPWQAVALNALATASAPPQLVAQVNAQTTLAVTPISLDTASAAELNISLQISNPTTTIDASKNTTSSFVRQDLANSIANYSVQTKVRVDSLKLFQVSSMSMDLTHEQSPVPIPIIGWAWEAVFGEVPGLRRVFEWPRRPATIQNRAVAVVRAVVVPTAMDMGLGLRFRDDRIEDPISGASKLISSMAQTGNHFQDFHQRLIKCILEGTEQNCMAATRLSDLLEPTYSYH